MIYVIWSVVYTVADVPYWGLSSAMTNNTDSRGKMLTVARLACTLGAGIVTVFVTKRSCVRRKAFEILA